MEYTSKEVRSIFEGFEAVSALRKRIDQFLRGMALVVRHAHPKERLEVSLGMFRGTQLYVQFSKGNAEFKTIRNESSAIGDSHKASYQIGKETIPMEYVVALYEILPKILKEVSEISTIAVELITDFQKAATLA